MAINIQKGNNNAESDKTYIGVVEDNNDPKKNGRCRIRVMDVFDGMSPDGEYQIKTEELPWAFPWKDLNGNAFNIPDIGKIVVVVFEEGNTDKPEYISADHYNVNLEKKLESLSKEDYLSMKSLIFDHKTQIYVNDTEGLKMDYKFNNINIKDQSINVNLKDNFAKLNLGTENATQRAILGDTFTNWLDELLNIFMSGAFLGNFGAPVMPSPALAKHIQYYLSIKDPKILSKNVFIVDNEDVKSLQKVNETTFKGSPLRFSDPTLGDNWTSTVQENNLTKKEEVTYQPVEGSSATTFDQPNPNSTKPATPATLEPQIKEDNPDIKIILEILTNKNYKLFTRENELNIIAVRNQCLKLNDGYTDEFVDKLYVLYKDSSANWKLKKYIFSTMPGKEFTLSQTYIDSNNLNNYTELINYVDKRISMKEFWDITKNDSISGVQILVPSQYINSFQMGTKFNSDALVTNSNSKQMIWLDNDFKRPEFLPSNLSKPISENKNGGGDFGISIQIGFPGGKKVGNWSVDGSQTFSTKEDASEFFELCKIHKDKWGDSFTYTLVTKTDWDNASVTAEANKQDAKKLEEKPKPPVVVKDNANAKPKLVDMTNIPPNEILAKVKELPSFKSIPIDYWITGIRSKADKTNVPDDVFYIFKGEEFISMLTGTTNPGKPSLDGEFLKYKEVGAAVVKAQEWYYDVWTPGRHNIKKDGGMKALRQVGYFLIYRDGNLNGKSEEIGPVTQRNDTNINFHSMDYNSKSTAVKNEIGLWSAGCQVINNVGKYYKNIGLFDNQKFITYVLLNQWMTNTSSPKIK
jgi:hypothetical protein